MDDKITGFKIGEVAEESRGADLFAGRSTLGVTSKRSELAVNGEGGVGKRDAVVKKGRE